MAEPRFISLVLTLEGRRSALAFVLLLGLTLTEGIGLVSLTGLVGMLDLQGMDQMTFGPLAWARWLPGEVPSLELVLSVFVGVLALRVLTVFAFGLLTACIQAGLTEKLRRRLYEAVCDARWEEVQILSRALRSGLTSERLGESDSVMESLSSFIDGGRAEFSAKGA
jgi:hypothetical protein